MYRACSRCEVAHGTPSAKRADYLLSVHSVEFATAATDEYRPARPQSAKPTATRGRFPRLSGGLFVQFYRLDMHIISGTLREHQRQQAAARANIQHMLHLAIGARAPSKMPSVPTFMAQRS